MTFNHEEAVERAAHELAQDALWNPKTGATLDMIAPISKKDYRISRLVLAASGYPSEVKRLNKLIAIWRESQVKKEGI